MTKEDGTTETKTTTMTDGEAKAEGGNSVAIGPNANSKANQSITLGDGAVNKIDGKPRHRNRSGSHYGGDC